MPINESTPYLEILFNQCGNLVQQSKQINNYHEKFKDLDDSSHLCVFNCSSCNKDGDSIIAVMHY